MLLEGKRIFYIDDDLKNRAVTQVILEREGATVGFINWGKEDVIEQLKGFQTVDLILLDLMFPKGLTGYQLFDQIRRYSEFAQVPIVAISASDPAIEVPKTRAKGFDGFISKPISLATLPQLVLSIIRGKQVWS